MTPPRRMPATVYSENGLAEYVCTKRIRRLAEQIAHLGCRELEKQRIHEQYAALLKMDPT